MLLYITWNAMKQYNVLLDVLQCAHEGTYPAVVCVDRRHLKDEILHLITTLLTWVFHPRQRVSVLLWPIKVQ